MCAAVTIHNTQKHLNRHNLLIDLSLQFDGGVQVDNEDSDLNNQFIAERLDANRWKCTSVQAHKGINMRD